MTFDAASVRAKFPALHQPTADGTLPVFFDNPAGTQVPQDVIDAVSAYYIHNNANSGGAFATSQRSDAMVQETRRKMADFLNAPSPEEIVFGPNMTTLTFGFSRALGQTLQAGDEIVLTRMDHDANVEPWRRIAADHGLVIRWADIRTEDCTLDMDSLEAALSDRTRVVATVHASNAVGTINPIEQIAAMAHAAGALYVVDAVQSAPHIAIDVQAIGCDVLLCSAYKFFGPHIGIMWGRYDLLNSLPAYKVRPSTNKPPHRWETGTPSFETIAGVGGALDYFEQLGATYRDAFPDRFSGVKERQRNYRIAMSTVGEYERELAVHLIDVLERIDGVRIAGITDRSRMHQRVPTIVFTMADRTPAEIARFLGEHHIYVWHGNYYAVEIMNRLGHEQHGMVRVGLAHYNTHAEIDQLEAALRAMP